MRSLAVVLVLLASPAHAQLAELELQSGASSLLVLGPLSGQTSVAAELSLSAPLTDALAWTGGARIGLGPWSSEAFARVSAAPRFGAFRPSAGLELGASARGDDDSGEALLAEGRAVSRDGMSPFYVGVHTTPLRFRLSQRFSLSAFELQIGTHLAPLGRFVRLHVGLLALGVTL
jgi:hypothetical protein